jgi:Ser/Thr protein kinase RdoA (MazF antagonist)
VSALSDLIDGVPASRRDSLYEQLADAALRNYDLPARHVTFLGHNSGVTFRVEIAGRGSRLLKVHAPVGHSDGLEPAAISAGLRWLAQMAELTEVAVQTPVPDSAGQLLSTVDFKGLRLPCSLRGWLSGRRVDRLTTALAYRLGEVMGGWHAFSELRGPAAAAGAACYDRQHLESALRDLSALTVDGLISAESWLVIEQAALTVMDLADGLGQSGDVFGVVHGDVQPDNVVVADDETVHLIDFEQLALAPYLWDLGVALYHYSYEDGSVRRAMVDGYARRRGLLAPPLALEAFVCAAALDNLAFQCSIPRQRVSPLFRTNVERFATGYCRDFVQGAPFALS